MKGFPTWEELVTLTLTFDRVILHAVVHHSSTSTYMPNVIEIEETSCGRTEGRTDGRTFETHFIRSTQTSRCKTVEAVSVVVDRLVELGWETL